MSDLSSALNEKRDGWDGDRANLSWEKPGAIRFIPISFNQYLRQFLGIYIPGHGIAMSGYLFEDIILAKVLLI